MYCSLTGTYEIFILSGCWREVEEVEEEKDERVGDLVSALSAEQLSATPCVQYFITLFKRSCTPTKSKNASCLNFSMLQVALGI